MEGSFLWSTDHGIEIFPQLNLFLVVHFSASSFSGNYKEMETIIVKS